MHRLIFAAALALAAGGCAQSSHPDPLLQSAVSSPDVQRATATCEERYQHGLATLAEVAACERSSALPQQTWREPRLAGMYGDIWRDKIGLYDDVDRGIMTKQAADRRFQIDARNRVSNVEAQRQGTY